ncbi:MAG: branched-chain amino acid ABC transporter permease [Desulfomonile tiedjei]|uniref:Branched-chain amino acid ABC transporter permease n=1 Tax=Desulfomonile tiedjei TaxID=2358 RepID=A0A9D6V6R2_9BACT|nr:branched-chain amino acid ABC transporter permease [Desulfomonile tiedjei]
MDWSIFFAQFISGLCRAMVLFLMASGLTLVFGVMRVINFAHGSFYMLGAYLAYSLTSLFATTPGSFWIALILAPLAVGLLGGLVEYLLLRRIYGKEHLLQILLTYALIFIFGDLVKMLWGVELRIVNMPPILSGFVALAGQEFPVYYFFIIGVGFAVAVGLWLLLRLTTLGKLVRAAAEHRSMVEMLGYNVNGLFTIVFMIATWLGGLAGVVIAPTVRLSLSMDMDIIIECFLVVIIGGLGNIWGALLAALITGELYSLGILVLEKYAMAFLFGLTAVIMILRPSGLLGRGVN